MTVLIGEHTKLTRRGLNYFVLIGDRWEDADLQGCAILVKTQSGRDVGQVLVKHFSVCELRELPKEVFTKHWLPECKNPIVLYDHVREMYPDQDVNGRTKVVALGIASYGS